MLKINETYMTSVGGIQIVRDGKHHIKVLTKYKPIRLRLDKVKAVGLIAYIHHVSAVQVTSVEERSDKIRLNQKYNNALRIIMRLQKDAKIGNKACQAA